MLNYIWGGLIVFALLFALWYDAGDAAHDTYRNGEPLPGAVNIKKTRHAVPVGLLADLAAILLAVYIVKHLFN